MGCCYSLKRPGSPSKTKLIDFTLVRSIGRGAFGKVCIVYHRGMKKHYALKYMSKRRLVCKSVAHNVIKELEILMELSHPFIVNLWFTFQDEQYIYMISDLLLGGDLRYHLNDGKFSEPRVKLYVCEIALALDYLHQRNIMHRDIKPDNILLDSAGHAYLNDFNLATKLEPNSLATSFSGTKAYIAPEILATNLGQINGYDCRIDWWSLAVTFYEFLRGRQPYEFTKTTSTAQMLQMIMNQSMIIPSQWSSDLIAFIKSLLNTNIEKRITSLGAFRKHRYMERIDFESVLARRISPIFIPKQNKLNFDPNFELEERIVESSPLHKHYRKKQISNRKRKTDSNNAMNSADIPPSEATTDRLSSHNVALEDAVQEITKSFVDYNRFCSTAHRITPYTETITIQNDPLNTSSPNCPTTTTHLNNNKLECSFKNNQCTLNIGKC